MELFAFVAVIVLLIAPLVAHVINDQLKAKDVAEPVQMESGHSHLRD